MLYVDPVLQCFELVVYVHPVLQCFGLKVYVDPVLQCFELITNYGAWIRRQLEQHVSPHHVCIGTSV